MTEWDLAIVGAGPAGAATAIGALRMAPSMRVALLDRAEFPRDKSCGDGIAPHVIDLLDSVGVTGIVDDHAPVPRLQLEHNAFTVDRRMARPAWVIPRSVFDLRLVEAARSAGAELLRHRVGELTHQGSPVVLDGKVSARMIVGADGAQSAIRRAIGQDAGPMAVALRGYAPIPSKRSNALVIVFATAQQPAYAWSFDRGDGLANVGYGELLAHREDRRTKAQLIDRLDSLLPGASDGGSHWRGHQLPLSSGRWRPAAGRVMLAGDAAGLVNPMTGEGIYNAVATGLAAGRAAAEAWAAGEPDTAGGRYARATKPLLAGHLRHIAVAARLCGRSGVIDAGLRASAANRRVFDDLVELGLAQGRITATTARGLLRELAGAHRWRVPRLRNNTKE